MAVNSISGYSTTRITGLTSGMDTDSLVQKLVQSEQSKIDRLFKANTKLGWQKDAYTSIKSMSRDFRNKFMSNTSKSNIWGASAYKAFKINMTESKYLDIKATSLAGISSHKITSVKMAEYANAAGEKHRNRNVQMTGTSGQNMIYQSTGKVTIADGQENVALSDVVNSDGEKVFNFEDSSSRLSFKINNETFVFDQSATLNDVMNEVNSRSAAGVKMSLNDGHISIVGNTPGKAVNVSNVSGSPAVFGTGATTSIFSSVAGTISAKSAISEGGTLGELASKLGKNLFGSDGKMSFSINGKTFSFTSDQSIDDVLNTVNSDPDADVTLSYSTTDDKFMIRTNSSGSGASLNVENISGKAFGEGSLFGIEAGSKEKFDTIDRTTDTIRSAANKMGLDLKLNSEGKFDFTVNGKTFTFSADAKIQTMIDTVNGDPDAGVTLSYSQISDQFVFTSKETGDNAKIELSNASDAVAFGGTNSFFGIAEGTVKGADAQITIDGETVQRATNTFVLDGIEFNLKMNFNVENEAIAEADEINFSVSQDVDSVVDKVKAFIEEYNSMVKYLTSLTKEEIDFDYEPLSQSERDSLSEDEISKWETEAKKGILRNDSAITSLLSDMRKALFDKVGETGLSAHDIGISTGNWYEYPNGEIVLDEDKLRAALAKNPDAVANVMAGVAEDDSYEGNGYITRLWDRLTKFENTLKNTNIKNTEKAISDNETSMDDLLKKMYEMEERYYMQFAQMETLLTKYQSQSEWLTQQLSSL